MALDSLISTGLDVAGTSFGLPTGVASGAVNGLLKIFGIKDLSCLGSQSMKKSSLEGFLSSMKTRFEGITNTQNYADFMTWLSREISQRGLEAPRYKSACSRAYNQQYIDKLNEMYKFVYKAGIFQETRITTEKDWKGGDLNYIKFKPLTLQSVILSEDGFQFTSQNNQNVTPNANDYLNSLGLGGINSQTTATPNLTTVEIPSSILAQLTDKSLNSGIPLETLKSTYINGGFTIDNNGRIIWSASAGNAQNNTSSYLLLGGGLALVYLAFFKKK